MVLLRLNFFDDMDVGPTIPEQKHSRESPSHYVSHLLGHEGSGSAFALLKQMGWATGLVAGEAPTSYSERYNIG